MTEFTRTPEHEKAVRRRFAVALGELSFEFQAIQQVVTHPAGYTFSYLFREDMGCWVAHHDHDPENWQGHVSAGEGDTPEAALRACFAAALEYDKEHEE